MIKNIIKGIFIDSEFENDRDFFKTIDFFKQFDEKQLSKIISIIYKKNYIKGEVLYNCGEDVKIFFILKRGEAELYSNTGTKKVSSNQFFNQTDVLSQKMYTSTAKVTEDSLIYIIYKQEFYDLVNANTWIGFKKLKKLFKKVKNVFK
ncbi:MAG: cyclic nucleotide-binding domain-containing protein [Endomicrobiaceae bacterium]|nr:cyclic nucleotide-binding domain-containing protein [Endomicrobiaceae bacterium]